MAADEKNIFVPPTWRNKRYREVLEWLVVMCSHIPDKGMQMVHYHGYYSNVSRGKRRKADQDGVIPYIMKVRDHPRNTEKIGPG